MNLVRKPNILQGFQCPFFAFLWRNTGKCQRQLNICQDALVRDQIITLKHKADGMVPVGIPVPVPVFLCRCAVNDQISFVIAVQSANDIEECGLS